MTTYTYEDAPARPRRRRWGRRLLIVFLVLLLVLGGLLVVADRVAASVAERAIGDEVAKQLVAQDIRTSSPPDVGVNGFPFLTQVLGGKYESITIGLRDLEGNVEGNAVRVPRFDADARDVTASLDSIRSGQGDIVAQTVDATATISYASVVDFMNQPDVRLSEREGKLFVSAPVTFAGQRITITGTASDLTYEDGKVRIRFEELTAEDVPQLPGVQALINQFARQISISFALPALPFEVDVSEVRAQPEGLVVNGQATNVPLNRW